METMNPTYITVEARIQAPVEKVWQYWNEPRHIMEWCHASDDWYVPAATNDPVTGGKFSTTMAARDESMRFDWAGVYDRVDHHSFISYTMGDGRKVNVRFQDLGNETLVTENFMPENENSHEMQQAGWQAILDNFKKYVEQQQG